MTKLLIGGLLATAFAASVPAIAQVPAGTAAPQRPVAHTAKSRADVQAAVARRFARMDSNRDGFVTQAEADALRTKRAERGQKRAKSAGRRDPAQMFARLDANNDGTITRAEAEAARTARVVARGKPANAHAVAFGGLFERLDANRDGNISRAEFDAAPPKGRMAGKRGGNRHAGMKHGLGGRLSAFGDANKDGRVSLAEAQQAAISRFDRFDINRDGQVTPDERRQWREQRRSQRQARQPG